MSRERLLDLKMKLVEREEYSDRLFLGHFTPVEEGTELPSFAPGQFVQVWVKAPDGLLLRRPISIYDSNERVLSLLIQSAGRATQLLMQAPVGAEYQILLPLGNSFELPPIGSHPLLVGGGVGVAPMYALGKEMKQQGITPSFLLGARSQAHFSNLRHFEELGTLHISTEDGSLGSQGFVTDHPILREGHFTHIYMCGPTPMMKAVAHWAKQQGLPAQASLENKMACGIGVCLCCVEPTVKGHQTVCHDGPVFHTSQLLWE